MNQNVNEDGFGESLQLSMERIRAGSSEAVVSHTWSILGDFQKCGICSRLLVHRSPCSNRMLTSNDLPVVAVLVCGHVYHADCLEKAVPDIHMHDPPCPQCDQPENTNAKAPVLSAFGMLNTTSKRFKSKFSRTGPKFPTNAKSSASGRKATSSSSIPTEERGLLCRSLSKQQFSFRGKSSKDSISKKPSSPAQVSPEGRIQAEILSSSSVKLAV